MYKAIFTRHVAKRNDSKSHSQSLLHFKAKASDMVNRGLIPSVLVIPEGDDRARETARLIRTTIQEITSGELMAIHMDQGLVFQNISHVKYAATVKNVLQQVMDEHPVALVVLGEYNIRIVAKFITGTPVNVGRKDYVVVDIPDHPSRKIGLPQVYRLAR
jgi:hypothetical protein